MHLHVVNSPQEMFLQTVKHLENERSLCHLANVVKKTPSSECGKKDGVI